MKSDMKVTIFISEIIWDVRQAAIGVHLVHAERLFHKQNSRHWKSILAQNGRRSKSNRDTVPVVQ